MRVEKVAIHFAADIEHDPQNPVGKEITYSRAGSEIRFSGSAYPRELRLLIGIHALLDELGY